MKNWESLIASRMRPCATICKIEDAGKRNQRMCEKRWRKNNPEKVKEIQKRSNEKRKNDPKRKEWQKEYDQRPERKARKKLWADAHREQLRAQKKRYRDSEKGHRKCVEYGKLWRERNREYDRKRKQEWYRRKHPNPRPIGRPRKEAA